MSTNPSALIAVSKPHQGNLLLVDMTTLQATATIFVITANHRCIAQFDTVPAMVTTLRDHPDRLSRLWGFHLHAQKILIYEARRFTFAPTDVPGQTVHLFPDPHLNEPIFRTMVVEVPLANILSISWEENPVAIVGSTFVPTTVVLKEPDAEYYHDGSSKVKDRYHISIGSPIPGGTDPHAALWKTISDDSGLANFPTEGLPRTSVASCVWPRCSARTSCDNAASISAHIRIHASDVRRLAAQSAIIEAQNFRTSVFAADRILCI